MQHPAVGARAQVYVAGVFLRHNNPPTGAAQGVERFHKASGRNTRKIRAKTHQPSEHLRAALSCAPSNAWALCLLISADFSFAAYCFSSSVWAVFRWLYGVNIVAVGAFITTSSRTIFCQSEAAVSTSAASASSDERSIEPGGYVAALPRSAWAWFVNTAAVRLLR